MPGRKTAFIVTIAAAFPVMAAVVFLYMHYDPGDSVFWPKCPFHLLTGLECPGCGSQRALHCLLNGNLGQALHYNALLAAAVPYLLLYAFLSLFRHFFGRGRAVMACRRLEDVLYHGKALRAVLAVILLFWAARNFTPLF